MNASVQQPESSGEAAVTIVEGNAFEEFMITRSDLLEWAEPETLIIKEVNGEDVDVILPTRMGNRLLSFVNMTSKSKKALTHTKDKDGDEWFKFKRVFGTVCNLLQSQLVFKVSNGEVVGIMPVESLRIANSTIKGTVLTKINASASFKQAYIYESHDELSVVFRNTKQERVEFAGKEWAPGIVFTHSSTGAYSPYIVPCLVPTELNYCSYSLVTSLDEVTLYLDETTLFADDLVQKAESVATYADALTKHWGKALKKHLSLLEYEKLMAGFMDAKDTQPEYQLLGRLAQIYDAYGADDENQYKNKDWLKTASAGTTFGDFLNVALDIPPSDPSEKFSPIYAVGEMAESTFHLDNIAFPKRSLDSLTWDAPEREV